MDLLLRIVLSVKPKPATKTYWRNQTWENCWQALRRYCCSQQIQQVCSPSCQNSGRQTASVSRQQRIVFARMQIMTDFATTAARRGTGITALPPATMPVCPVITPIRVKTAVPGTAITPYSRRTARDGSAAAAEVGAITSEDLICGASKRRTEPSNGIPIPFGGSA